MAQGNIFQNYQVASFACQAAVPPLEDFFWLVGILVTLFNFRLFFHMMLFQLIR